MILIVDFGSQTTHLITRRLKELGTKTIIVLPQEALGKITKTKPKGIILSGGPASVYGKAALSVDKRVFEQRIPVLGICYGQQLMSYLLGGEVTPGKKREFGPATLEIGNLTLDITKDLPKSFVVWMNHGDEVKSVPPGFQTLATTDTIPHALMACEKRKLYGLQFHPELIHTQFGDQILKNFLGICGITPQKQSVQKELVVNLIQDVKDSIGKKKAICALSGGVDSSVAALLVHEAIGKNLTSFYIDSGLMRQDETKFLQKTFIEHYKMKVKIIKAKDIFLNNLRGVSDPEKKRTIIGKTFIQIFEHEAKKINAPFLVQGTIYPDVIESKGTLHSQKIKSHHNVGGLPKNMKMTLIEPLRQFYKDEVREIGKLLKLPDSITQRQPFPGPGLAIRIIGDVTDKKLSILRKADAIVRSEIEKAGLDHQVWQAFAVFTGIKTTGVRGDNRCYGETIGIRALEATDAMSARWTKLPYALLDTISSRIVNEVKEVNRVVYDITTKPPATMEWE